MRGRGAPLKSGVRDHMEPRFGRDFSNVRVHTGSGASAVASDLGARAFTVGNDIFFSAGTYNSGSDTGRRLIAHELTHTVQQGGGSAKARPMRVQRKKGQNQNASKSEEELTPGKFVDPKTKASIDTTTKPKNVTLPQLLVPKIGGKLKGKKMRGLAEGRPGLPDSDFVFGGRVERGDTARQQWLTAVNRDAVEKKVQGFPNTGVLQKGEPVHYLQSKSEGKKSSFLIIGTAKQIANNENVLIPTWTKEGKPQLFDVDHIHELQLGGIDGMANFWLLTQGANRSAGSRIADHFKDDVRTLLDAAEHRKDADGTEKNFWQQGDGGKRPEMGELRRPAPGTWSVGFKAVKGDPKFDKPADNWTKEEIEEGKQLSSLKPMTEKEIAAAGLKRDGDEPRVVSVFTSPTGGFRRRIDVTDKSSPKLLDTDIFKGEGEIKQDQFYKGFAVTSISYTFPPDPTPGKEIGTIVGTVFPSKYAEAKAAKAGTGKPQPKTGISLPILWDPILGFSGYVNDKYLNERMGRLIDLDGLSPVTLKESGITEDGQIFARGYLSPTKALFASDLQIPIEILGNKVTLQFPIPTDKLNFGPVSVTEAALEVGIGDRGVFFGGYADVAIAQVGSGRVEGQGDKGGGIIKGTFNFDLNFLDKSQAGFTYDLATDTLELTFSAAVKKGTVPGVAGGKITATFSRDRIDLTGVFDLAKPLDGSTATLGYTKETGLTIGAENIPLPIEKIPGVKDAKASVKANRNPETGDWKVSGGGSGTFELAGVKGQVVVAIDGSGVMITCDGAFSKGLASGKVNATITNLARDPQGVPIPDQPPTDTFSVSGSGSASLKFGILTGTVGLT